MAKLSSVELWTISKCKRIVRPLVSKIHTLNEQYTSFPSILDFDFDQYESFVNTVPNPYPERLHPKTSQDRIYSLKPFISPELFQSYKELFQIFKTIINSIIAHSEQHSSSGSERAPALLSTLCAFKIGESIAQYTKTSHYKLSNSLLFDKNLETDNEFLDDIDKWLEMEPLHVTTPNRSDLIVGYVIHLLVFYLDLLFYTLIPVLIHWLVEELTRAPQFRAIAGTFFHEFWYKEISTNDPFQTLLPSQRIFYSYIQSGYWRAFIEDLGFKLTYSSLEVNSTYDALILEGLPLSKAMDDHKVQLLIYNIIRNCPQNKMVNNILINILSRIIHKYRHRLEYSTSSLEKGKSIDELYTSCKHYVRTWLGFSPSGCVFNSFLPGNDEIFTGLIKVSKNALKVANSIGDDTSSKFRKSRILSMYQSIIILRSYFLEEELKEHFQDMDLEMTSSFLAQLQSIVQKKRPRHKNSNVEFDEFLFWLSDTGNGNEVYKKLAVFCYKSYYGDRPRFWSHSVASIYKALIDALSDSRPFVVNLTDTQSLADESR